MNIYINKKIPNLFTHCTAYSGSCGNEVPPEENAFTASISGRSTSRVRTASRCASHWYFYNSAECVLSSPRKLDARDNNKRIRLFYFFLATSARIRSQLAFVWARWSDKGDVFRLLITAYYNSIMCGRISKVFTQSTCPSEAIRFAAREHTSRSAENAAGVPNS